MNRRNAITTLSLGTAGFVVGTGFSAPACPGGKNLSTYVLIITQSYGEIKNLLPDLGFSSTTISKISDLIAQAIKIAEQFDKAYKAGAFQNAAQFFNQLGTLSLNIANELNVSNNRIVKGILAGIGIARVTIAAMLQSQADQLPAARTARLSPEAAAAKAEIERLNRVDLDAVLKSTTVH